MTKEQLRLIDPSITSTRLDVIVPLLNEMVETYKLPSEALPEFLSNIIHESGSFSIKAENMNYTTPARLVAIWKTRFTLTGEPNKKDARQYTSNPRLLANLVYGGRMGNIQPNDGYNFRGGGFAQITGRDAYTLFTDYVNRRDLTRLKIEEVAALVQSNDDWAMDSAFWFFCEFKNLEQMAIDDKFKDLVKRWNGGYIGLEDRTNKYNKALEVLGSV